MSSRLFYLLTDSLSRIRGERAHSNSNAFFDLPIILFTCSVEDAKKYWSESSMCLLRFLFFYTLYTWSVSLFPSTTAFHDHFPTTSLLFLLSLNSFTRLFLLQRSFSCVQCMSAYKCRCLGVCVCSFAHHTKMKGKRDMYVWMCTLFMNVCMASFMRRTLFYNLVSLELFRSEPG